MRENGVLGAAAALIFKDLERPPDCKYPAGARHTYLR